MNSLQFAEMTNDGGVVWCGGGDNVDENKSEWIVLNNTLRKPEYTLSTLSTRETEKAEEAEKKE